MQQEVERTRQQANEALKAMDAERQQLRSANNKLRDTIEELRGSLLPKENTIETLQQSLLDKDQVVEDLKKQLQAAEERRQTAVTELSAKHQKKVAEGRVWSSNPTDTVHLQPLGPNASKVSVDVPLVGNAKVWKPSSAIQTIDDALGSLVAWPSDKLLFM